MASMLFVNNMILLLDSVSGCTLLHEINKVKPTSGLNLDKTTLMLSVGVLFLPHVFLDTEIMARPCLVEVAQIEEVTLLLIFPIMFIQNVDEGVLKRFSVLW